MVETASPSKSTKLSWWRRCLVPPSPNYPHHNRRLISTTLFFEAQGRFGSTMAGPFVLCVLLAENWVALQFSERICAVKVPPPTSFCFYLWRTLGRWRMGLRWIPRRLRGRQWRFRISRIEVEVNSTCCELLAYDSV